MFIISALLRTIPWEKAIKLIWNACDEELKKKVIESENKIDDVAFNIVDQFMDEL